jgi:RNA polymerase sigma factor (sigma-70 family)
VTTSSRHRHAFPSTRWSRILAASGGRDFEALAQAYWRPIRAYLATRLCCRDADAEDLAQEAFAFLLRTRLFERADPARGSFRGLLKAALGNFAIEQLRKQAAGKRGGGRVHEAIDDGRDLVDPRAATPDQVLDASWRRELLERAAAQLEDELTASGRRTHFLLFRDYFLADGELDHAALAARHGITRTDVSNWLDHSKRRFRALLRALVLETVSGDEELALELRWLFGAEGARERP